MAKREYEKLVMKAIELDEADIVTASPVNGDGENYGSANEKWWKTIGGEF
jgi:hypothetical protein